MIDVKNILIVRTDRIGDVVLTTPLAKIIKNHYPDSRITFLVRDYTKPLLFNNPFIDDILTLDEKNGTLSILSNLKKIKQKNFDAVIIVYPRFRISLISFLAGIKIRVGTGYRWYSFLFNRQIYEHRKSGDKHELVYNLNLLEKLGIKNLDKNNVSFDIHLSRNSEQRIEELYDKHHIDRNKKSIIIHPGSGGSSIDLPFPKFLDLTERLARDLTYNIIITGNESEKLYCDKFIVDSSVHNFAGKLDLYELIALINKSDLVIANSTGPIHIAAALKKFVIGFYPKIKECSVQRWGPYTDKRKIFEPTIDCRDCTREQCGKLDCMSSIDINDVEKTVHKVLNEQDKK